MPSSGKSNRKNEATWIPESRCFFANVLKDTLAKLRGSDLIDVNRNERTQLKKLEKLWLAKYKPNEQRPESNPCPLPKPKRLPRKRTATATTTTTSEETAEEEEYANASTLDDNLDIIYRIKIPRLRPNWSFRTIDLKIKAYVCKKNLIEPLINWQLLDSVMVLPLSEGTALFQRHVDQMLQSADI